MAAYLDAAATSAVKPEVVAAMMPYFGERWFNPSSPYGPARAVAEDVAGARKAVAERIGAKDWRQVFFTSGGSEGNSWAVAGFARCRKDRRLPAIAVSAIEHGSVLRAARAMAEEGAYVESVRVDGKGFASMGGIERFLKEASRRGCKALVSVQFANGEIGTVQDVAEISRLVHGYGGVFHTDAVQAFGHEDVDVERLGIDIMTASGHKIGAPKGIGFLYARNAAETLAPLIYGTQMGGMRGGTENVPYIMGFKKAAELAGSGDGDAAFKRDYLASILKREFGCRINGPASSRLANNVSATFGEGVSGESLIYMLDTCGIYVSAGSACESSSDRPSHVLKAIGLSDGEARRTLRITVPEGASIAQIHGFADELGRQLALLRST